MNKHILKTLLLLALGFVTVSGQAQIIEHREFAAEITTTDFGSTLTNGGIFYVKRCDQCSTDAVSFNNATRYYRKSSAISKAAAVNLNGNGATVFYQPVSKLVTRVVFWE